MQHAHNFDRFVQDPVNDDVVRVCDEFARAGHATRPEKIRMLSGWPDRVLDQCFHPTRCGRIAGCNGGHNLGKLIASGRAPKDRSHIRGR